MQTPPPLAGKVALVMGASGGIGAASARALAQQGATIMAVYGSDAAAAQALIADLPGQGHGAAQATLEDSAGLSALAALVSARWGRLDILVNAAGVTRPVRHDDLPALDDEFIDQMFRSHWRGPFASIRALLPLLQAGLDGLVVNISSLSASTGIGSNIAYCAAKAGLDAMTRSLARALAPGVRVLSVSPGVVDTNFVPGRDADFNARVSATIPLRRIGTPEDVAAAVVACATLLPYSTGSVILVDGGRALA